MKKIGVLTSGGDTPGMNAAIRAVFKVADNLGYDVMGIFHGLQGLIDGKIRELTHEDCENMVHKGGTILRTSRSEEFKTDAGQEKAVRMLKAFQIDALIVIGGDGSMHGAAELAKRGVAVYVLPGTIDNDLSYTDYTIGFDTAINSVMNEIYKIRDTMSAHDRVGVVEVMGRACGDIALHAGVACGADCIVVPEVTQHDFSVALDQLVSNKLKGKLTSIVLIAEGAGHAQEFCDYVRCNSDVEIKPVVLGYILRGGNPTTFDRVNAARMGERAVKLIDAGIINRAIGIRDNKIVDFDLTEALDMTKDFDDELYKLNDVLSRF